MTWIKICGITNVDDALTAVDAGADALGFVFYEKSPRKVDLQTTRKIVQALPKAIEKVGVFVNQDEDSICAAADEAGLTAVQLHGDSLNPHIADEILERRPDIKVVIAISMDQKKPEAGVVKWNPKAVHAFLVDAANTATYGGSGETFDWQASRPSVEAIARAGRVVVAGGLDPDNVGEAIRILKPWGVDVSSGVEASPGKKDPEKLRDFIKAARRHRRREPRKWEWEWQPQQKCRRRRGRTLPGALGFTAGAMSQKRSWPRWKNWSGITKKPSATAASSAV